jgi:hypothetical protein
MSKHTPGPWNLAPKAVNHQLLYGPVPGLIADIHKDEDARLIAAAPDLLAALQHLLLTIGSDPELEEYLETGSALARAAIAKATGETP